MKKAKLLSGVLALTFILSGCSTGIKDTPAQTSDAPEVTTESTATETTTASSETTKETEPFVFNPHVHSNLISEVCKDEWWDSFYKMCDAMREGKETFECVDEDCYKFCTNDVIIGAYFPAACTLVVGDGFKDGVGKLKYKMDKDKFLERQQAFEKEIERMLNEAIRTDYSEFEKVMGIYAYMCKYFKYDFAPLDGQGIDDFSDYACLTKKNGICCEFAGAFTYLLLQAGVDATPFEGDGDSGYHGWTYVVVGGKGYHCDATWGAHGEDPDADLLLMYFMLTEKERLDNGFEKEKTRPDIVWPFVDEVKSTYPADDTTFAVFHDYIWFVSMDTERNVIIYKDVDGRTGELSYGDL